MFVDKIDINEFRGVKKCKSPISFSNVTVLIGRNNSGKSSILEALSLLPSPDITSSTSNSTSNENKLNLITGLHGGRSSIVYGYFGSAKLQYTIANQSWTITINQNGMSNTKYTTGENRVTVSVDTAIHKLFKYKNRTIPNLVQKEQRFEDLVFFIPDDNASLSTLLAKINADINRNMIIKSGAHRSVVRDIINDCVDDDYTELLFTPELSARKESGKDGNPMYIKIKDLGAGIEKVALIASWVDTIKPELIIWDDFEGSAHPTLINSLLKWLSKKNCQVILSTHSIDVLTGLLEIQPKDTKVIQLSKK